MENKNHIDQIGKRKNEEIFSKTPENYFENLPSEIKHKIYIKTSQKKQKLYPTKYVRGWGIVAGIASVMLFLVYFNYGKTNDTNEYAAYKTYEEFLENELVNTIDINTDYEILNVSNENKIETEIISDKIPSQILENYLMEEDEELILYN